MAGLNADALVPLIHSIAFEPVLASYGGVNQQGCKACWAMCLSPLFSRGFGLLPVVTSSCLMSGRSFWLTVPESTLTAHLRVLETSASRLALLPVEGGARETLGTSRADTAVE